MSPHCRRYVANRNSTRHSRGRDGQGRVAVHRTSIWTGNSLRVHAPKPLKRSYGCAHAVRVATVASIMRIHTFQLGKNAGCIADCFGDPDEAAGIRSTKSLLERCRAELAP